MLGLTAFVVIATSLTCLEGIHNNDDTRQVVTAEQGKSVLEMIRRIDEKIKLMEANIVQNGKGMKKVQESIESITAHMKDMSTEDREQWRQMYELRRQQLNQTQQIQEQGKQIHDLATKVDRFHPVTTPGPTMQSTSTPSSPWIYYPPGTRQNRAKRVYSDIKLKFVGYGQPDTDDYSRYWGCTFDYCLQYCGNLRLKDNKYTGMVYGFYSRFCGCVINGSGHRYFNSELHYRFY